MPDMHLDKIEMDDPYCSGQPKPGSSRPCIGHSTNICWGAQYNSTGIKNGRCEDGTCVCRTGQVGLDCTAYGSLFDVTTNGAQFTDGIPLNEVLQIRWNSSISDLPTVNIILLKNLSTLASNETGLGSDWNIGEYLVSGLPNTGYYEWTVGSTVTDLELGNGYIIRVWYSTNLYADSAEFTISDPCAYKNCGLHGVCTDGSCVCQEGFSGTTCEQGPCERANCRSESSTCDNSVVITDASIDLTATYPNVCNCTGGWSGSQCRTPPSCEGVVTCLNGGDFDLNTGVIRNDTKTCTGQCSCLNSWSGTSCETCGLTCSSHGTSDTTCAGCTCENGYSGKNCQCRYYILSMGFDMETASWQNDSTAIERFKETLSVDMESASSTPTNVTVEDVTFPKDGRVEVKLRFQTECSETSAMRLGGYIRAAADVVTSEDSECQT